MVDLTEGVIIGGRKFRQATDMTFEQEVFVMSVVTDAGLHNLKPANATEDGLQDMALSIINKAYASGKLMLLIASVLQEEGTEWSRPMVEANANFFAGLKDRESKDTLLQVMTMALIAFFAKGDAEPMTSLKSSEGSHLEPAGGVPESEPTGEASTSESGQR